MDESFIHVQFRFYPGLLHSMRSSVIHPMAFHAVHFSYAYVDYQTDQWSIESCCQPLPLKPVMPVHAYQKMAALLKELNLHWTARPSGYELLCGGLMLQLYYGILQDGRHTQFSDASRLKVEDMIRYIGQNLHQDLSIRQFSERTGLSPDYLSSLFKAYTGYPPVRFINKCRVDAAKLRLERRDVKIKAVALEFGFKDEFYFSRIFKQFEGISPLEYRRRVAGSGT